MQTLFSHWSSWLLVLIFLNDLFTAITKHKHCLVYSQNIRKKKNAATNVEKKYRREPIQQKMKYERAKQLYGWCNF